MSNVKIVLFRIALILLSRTWRIRENIPEDCRPIIEQRQIGVIAFWHGKMLPIWYCFRKKGCSALISSSNDGTILFHYLDESLHYHEIIRGSSSRDGGEALHQMVDVLQRRSCLITPDGPRGPALKPKAGVLIASQRSQKQLLLVNWSSSKSYSVNSWDSMSIPLPFARINMNYFLFNTDRLGAKISESDLHELSDMLNQLGSNNSGRISG